MTENWLTFLYSIQRWKPNWWKMSQRVGCCGEITLTVIGNKWNEHSWKLNSIYWEKCGQGEIQNKCVNEKKSFGKVSLWHMWKTREKCMCVQ